MPSRPPDGPTALFVLRVGDDDPKACTGRRLLLRGLARAPPGSWGIRGGLVVLDPYARDPISRDDVRNGPLGGLLAVDCSWNRLGAAGRFRIPLPRGARHRRLPWLLAANPQHFGRPTELNTAEALAAALAIYGETDRARALIETFPGGRGFLPLNAVAFARYAAAADAEGVRAAEQELFGAATPPGTPDPPSGDAPSAPPPGSRAR